MENSKSKYYWGIVAIAALAVLGMVFVLNDYLAKDAAIVSNDTGSKNAETKARLLIDFGNGKKRAFRGEVIGGMTVQDTLLASMGEVSFRVDGDGIKEIDGVKNNSHHWQYYVNGEKKTVLPEFEEVNPGDEIVFRLE